MTNTNETIMTEAEVVATEVAQPETKRRLERQTCGRCGGSGHYSYCAMYGTTCFGCSGSGEKYTKRGAAALVYLKSLRSRKVSELKVGDVIKNTNSTTWRTIVEITTGVVQKWATTVDGVRTEHSRETLTVTTKNLVYAGMLADSVVEVLLSKDQQRETMTMALEYQESLTKSGTPRKVAKKK